MALDASRDCVLVLLSMNKMQDVVMASANTALLRSKQATLRRNPSRSRNSFNGCLKSEFHHSEGTRNDILPPGLSMLAACSRNSM